MAGGPRTASWSCSRERFVAAWFEKPSLPRSTWTLEIEYSTPNSFAITARTRDKVQRSVANPLVFAPSDRSARSCRCCSSLRRGLLPAFGIEPLKIAGSVGAVVLMSCASSVAAVGFGLLIAMFARSVEQATGFGAAAVLILAAIGGIMVPKMMMPLPMQTLASWSPLGVALDGFLDIFVRGAGLKAITPHATFLILFAAVCLVIAMIRFNRLSRER